MGSFLSSTPDPPPQDNGIYILIILFLLIIISNLKKEKNTKEEKSKKKDTLDNVIGLESVKGEILSGVANIISVSLNYGWNFTSFSTYVGGGISSHATKIEYIDPISKFNQKFEINSLYPNMNLGFEYIGSYNELFYIVNFGIDISFGTKSLEISNNNNEYELNGGGSIWRLNFGTSFK